MIKPGMFIGDRYEIIDKAGSGGMADVYKAKCHRLNRYVAIKILKPEFSSDKNFVMKFRGEAQSAAGLSHPNIVSVYDVGDDDIEGIHFIVMELVEGITLKRFIERKGRLDIKESIGIAIQIAQGMEAAHANHIIHRDIKPQNIIISRDGKVKVADFGIAKAATSDTVTQNAIGSVHYLSPEQARGGYSDERSDVYSLGVTLYEMLSGQVPFAGDNSVSVALLHIQGEAKPLHEINPDIPRGLDMIVQKCMQKKPERRYAAASELIHDLKRSLMNPNGDFVKMAPGIVMDSPTIHLSDEEMSHIKSAAKSPTVYYDVKREPVSKKIQKEEEEELDNIDSRLEKILLPLSIVAAVALGLTILFLLAKFFGLFGDSNSGNEDILPTPTTIVVETPSPSDAAMPDPESTIIMLSVLGKEEEDARATLNLLSDKLVVEVVEGGYSELYEVGRVMEQSVVPGDKIDENGTIILKLSKGIEIKFNELPHISDIKRETAFDLIEAQGFVPEPKYENHDTIEAGMVIRTDPGATQELALGTTVYVYISLGPNVNARSEVPNLLNMSKDKARSELERVGLKLGNVGSIYSDEYSKDRVCYQSYSSGDKIERGTQVDITISLGSEPVPTEAPTKAPTEAPTPEPTIEPEPTVSEPEPTSEPEEDDNVQVGEEEDSEGEGEGDEGESVEP